jgi:hypothetical protein
MRTLLLGAAAAAAMIAPGMASANTSGSVGVLYEANDFDYGSGEFQAFNLGGALVHNMSNGLTLQLDGRTTLQDWDCCDSYYSHGYAATHLSSDMGGWDLGGVLGIVNYYGEGGILIGVEARTMLGNFALDGSVGHTDFADNGYDGTAFRAGGGFFFTPNLALTGGASFTDINSFTDYEITELSIGGAYQFTNNVEVYGGYTNTDGERSTGTSYEGDTFQIGLRLNINGGTLQENAADGAWTSAEHISDTWMRW